MNTIISWKPAAKESRHPSAHRKLGTVQSVNSPRWQVNWRVAGTYVSLAYRTTYARGEAEEQFAYLMQKGTAILVGYHVNSNALILNGGDKWKSSNQIDSLRRSLRDIRRLSV